MITISLDDRPFNKFYQEKLFKSKLDEYGAIVSFTGIVRRHDTIVPLEHLYIEYYPQLTEQEIYRIVIDAKKRWKLKSVLVIHRVGQIFPNEEIIFIAVASLHRTEAFQAAEFIMDYLKTEAPFWKKEYLQNGTSRWVEAKTSDQLKKNFWSMHKWQ
ncbi:Molybdopterin synthase catalytic subunit [Commensalibacter sp. Nvir]|uniref:molybdenum cofactor biosynthesis protein MoaE n=1 Tax=Commensalibacter sp. Nvir TaxID=3069817 RepID=UPI002D4CC25F|nr:Molybdopterin synthase catalytic subunit [Commensalibacter sp. Nvir]